MASEQHHHAVTCAAQPLNIAFHPSRDLVSAALVDGSVEVHDYAYVRSPPQQPVINNVSEGESDDSDDEEDGPINSIETLLSSTKGHTKSCRDVLFSHDGEYLYSGGSDGVLNSYSVEYGSNINPSNPQSCQPSWTVNETGAINRMFQLPLSAPSGPILATGDEDGCVKLWDVRTPPTACCIEYSANEDFISGFDCDESGNTLLASSADCTLSVFDMRKKKRGKQEPFARSEDQEDELLSICVLKRGKKVVCGTQEGILHVWSWGRWADMNDRFTGHPNSIDALLKVDEDTVVTGGSDGLLRVISIQPNKLLGVLGDHGGFPVEEMKFNRDRSFIATVTYDNSVRFWDASLLTEEEGDVDKESREEEKEEVDAVGMMRTAGVGLKVISSEKNSDDEWEDLDDDDDEEEEESDSDSDSDDSDDSDNRPEKGRKKLKTDNERFFEDL